MSPYKIQMPGNYPEESIKHKLNSIILNAILKGNLSGPQM